MCELRYKTVISAITMYFDNTPQLAQYSIAFLISQNTSVARTMMIFVGLAVSSQSLLMTKQRLARVAAYKMW